MTTGQKTYDRALLDTGEVIDGKWVLMEPIGEGGMGVVYRAHQLNLKRDVAIKIISEKMLADLEDNPQERATAISRFQREVQTMAQVRHINVLQIYDYGTLRLSAGQGSRQVEYIAMEYVPGNTFRYTMSAQGVGDESDLLTEWLREYFLPVLDGLAAIHNHGIVHRDMKPENILMDGDVPKIADFGLARSLKLRGLSNSWDVKGTWPYMAPEQFADFRKAGVPADIYSLGRMLYEAVVGKLDKHTPPFKQVGLTEPATPLMEGLDRVIRKATSEDPKQRYQAVAELRQDLRAVLEAATRSSGAESKTGPSPLARRRLWFGIAAAILSMVAMTVYHIWEMVQETKSPSGKESSIEPGGMAISDREAPKRELTPTRLGADGRKMQLIEDPQSDRRFYADSALVTVHHFLEFLNAVAAELSVVDGVVRRDEAIFYYLEDQVVFRNGRFQLLDAAQAPRPVFRVTWLGAGAYARHFGNRLPTFQEWSLIRKQVPGAIADPGADPVGSTDASSSHMHMMDPPSPQEPGAPGGKTSPLFREWVSVALEGKTVSRIAAWPTGNSSPGLVRRYPWEGFAEVGFRTVMELKGNSPQLSTQ